MYTSAKNFKVGLYLLESDIIGQYSNSSSTYL